jgi:hypothetical protein
VFFSVESPFELATHVDTARRELLVDDPPADRDDLDDFLLDHRTMDRRDERLTGISVTVVTTIVVVCSTLSSAIAPRGGGGGSLVHVALSPLGVGVGGFFVLSASAATASVGNVVATTTTVGILQSTLSHEASAVLSSPLAFASQSSTGASGSGVSDGLVASASSPGAVGERGAVVEAAAPTPASCSDGLGRPFVWSWSIPPTTLDTEALALVAWAAATATAVLPWPAADKRRSPAVLDTDGLDALGGWLVSDALRSFLELAAELVLSARAMASGKVSGSVLAADGALLLVLFAAPALLPSLLLSSTVTSALARMAIAADVVAMLLSETRS